MYIKMVKEIDANGVSDKNGSADEKVVPYETFMLEVKKISYSKHNFGSIKEMDSFLEIYPEYEVPFGLPTCEPSDRPEGYPGHEIMVVKLYEAATLGVLIVCDCALYIMNDDGKTVETLRCN